MLAFNQLIQRPVVTATSQPVPPSSCSASSSAGSQGPAPRGVAARRSWLSLCGAAAACSFRNLGRGGRRRRLRTLRRVLQPFATEPVNPFLPELLTTARLLATAGACVLDCSEGPEELEDRLEEAGIESPDQEDRRSFRECLYGTSDLGQYLSGAILNDEALYEEMANGRSFPAVLQDQGVLVGVRADTGLFPINGYGEKGTGGLPSLLERAKDYYKQGARFALWCVEMQCTFELPNDSCVFAICYEAARAAVILQAHGMVPVLQLRIVSPVGKHPLERTAYVAEKVYSQTLRQLNELDVFLEAAFVMTTVSGAGPEVPEQPPQEAVISASRKAFWRTFPPALSGIMLAPGTATVEEAAAQVVALQQDAPAMQWPLIPVYSLQSLAAVISTWASSQCNVALTRQAFESLLKAGVELRKG